MKGFANRNPLTQCEGKVAYGSWREARSGRLRMHNLEIYRCPHCGQFHLGNKPKGQGRPKPPPPAIELEF
ncbi:hypothetical protein [Devosia ginsengisoli]|uniref:Uncharacterized protein n=1 Tax=Devosia ginsengisoli TaxID=400770 RepID=A0A5B8LQW4_9HYPH|nr:hypothetical protein [Devosia ginsengisoli]QDZ10543.1 hypothetical protein FPZ08_07135 [Devosia ginsengisoli]